MGLEVFSENKKKVIREYDAFPSGASWPPVPSFRRQSWDQLRGAAAAVGQGALCLLLLLRPALLSSSYQG